jgi:hypothetical protein
MNIVSIQPCETRSSWNGHYKKTDHRKSYGRKLINPFIEATLHVLKTIVSTSANAGKPLVKKEKVARGDVSGVQTAVSSFWRTYV